LLLQVTGFILSTLHLEAGIGYQYSNSTIQVYFVRRYRGWDSLRVASAAPNTGIRCGNERSIKQRRSSVRTKNLKIIGGSLIILPVMMAAAYFFLLASPEKIDLQIQNRDQLDSRAIKAIEQAKKVVDEPAYPPKPEGRTETVAKTTYKTINVLGIKTKVPIQTAETRFIGPTTEEIQTWEAKVDELRARYDLLLETEAERILVEQNRQARKEEIKYWAAIIAPSISTIVGVFTLVLGVRNDRREQEKHEAEMRKHSNSESSSNENT
ncbi:MAG: hypothetical protein JAY64_04595, partial [Candidatus Thiodiazotropha weberae]|nr:hypothetical protein [Candidatus Thiodiazotropha lotti]MCG8010965.1 hypothetical protein [Candidatus Thiodiazotropha lotti]MCW4210428.1 hypothetical protein [Candidatus Thiodiazotropha lotti]MCW4217189.1 hypothetical protein [Candidatus Thiodiazotropha lotti]